VPPTPYAQSELVGTWRIVSFEDRDARTGEWVNSLGERPTGYLVYTPDGRVMVQLTGGLARGNAGAGSGDAAGGYIAYFGTWRVDRAAGTVTHFIEGALQPMADGQARPFALRGDTLTLGDGTTWRRTFVRERS